MPPSHEHTIPDLLKRAKADLTAWLQAEKAFITSEISARVEMAAQPIMAFGLAAVCAFFGGIALTVAAGLALGALLTPVLGFLIVALVYAGVGAVLFIRGRARLRKMFRMQVRKREAMPDADWAPPK